MDFKQVIERALKENVKIEYVNTPKPIVDSVLEIIKTEMQKSLKICPENGCNIHSLSQVIFYLVAKKFPNECNLNLSIEGFCGEYQMGFKNYFFIHFGSLRYIFTCFKQFT
jgi:hypothetical protein